MRALDAGVVGGLSAPRRLAAPPPEDSFGQKMQVRS